MNHSTQMFRCNAAFLVQGRWVWTKWTAASDGNKHAMILAKARELGAKGWDFGGADYHHVSEYPVSR